jgi:hypothetical protein
VLAGLQQGVEDAQGGPQADVALGVVEQVAERPDRLAGGVRQPADGLVEQPAPEGDNKGAVLGVPQPGVGRPLADLHLVGRRLDAPPGRQREGEPLLLRVPGCR